MVELLSPEKATERVIGELWVNSKDVLKLSNHFPSVGAL